MKLSVKNLCTYCECEHRNIGSLKNYCQEFSVAGLREGVNLLQGQLNGNGWGLVNCLCNSRCGENKIDGEFYLNGKKTGLREIRKMSYYICQSEYTFVYNIFNPKVGSLLPKELTDPIGCLLKEEGFLDRRLKYCGNWRYIVSFYIGCQKGKRIFGFPYLNTTLMEYNAERLFYIHEFAKSNDLCVLVPCLTGSEIFLGWSGYKRFECDKDTFRRALFGLLNKEACK